MSKIKELLEQDSKELILPELSTLEFYVNHIKDMALLKIENIF